MSDSAPQLGTTPENGSSRRDATHVSIVSAVALTDLLAGEHVGVTGQYTPAGHIEASNRLTHVGIVDPFLKGEVKRGEVFWLLLYPTTVTGLRHVWTHPAFPEQRTVARTKPSYDYDDDDEDWNCKGCY